MNWCEGVNQIQLLLVSLHSTSPCYCITKFKEYLWAGSQKGNTVTLFTQALHQLMSRVRASELMRADVQKLSPETHAAGRNPALVSFTCVSKDESPS